MTVEPQKLLGYIGGGGSWHKHSHRMGLKFQAVKVSSLKFHHMWS
jgi:hypothetical protein